MKPSSHSKNVVVLSATSDIGAAFARSRLALGDRVVGTYRTSSQTLSELKEKGMLSYYCDFSESSSVDSVCNNISSAISHWDQLLVAPGCLEPIGEFKDLSFDLWSDSFRVNFLHPLRAVHSLLPLRSGINSSVLFFAGSGTNGAADMFSAYTCSKIALIKISELLDSEVQDTSFTIVGPGWINTKIHSQTLSMKDKCSTSYVETERRINNNEFGSMNDLINCIDWIFSQEKEVVGGRNIAFHYDSWGTELEHLLRDNSELGKLRRFGNVLLSNQSLES